MNTRQSDNEIYIYDVNVMNALLEKESDIYHKYLLLFTRGAINLSQSSSL